jgi:HEAT repeat protein
VAPEGDEELVKQLFLVFNNSNNQAVKGFSLVSMGLIGGRQAVKHLNRIVQRGKSSERAWACLGLGFALRKQEDPGAEDQLIRWTTGSGNRSTRSAACVALGLCKSAKAVPELIRILEKGDHPFLRGYAALALGMINDPRALEPLRTAMKKDRLPQVLSQTVLALGLMHDLESAPDLMECMVETPNIVIKGMISRALQYMGEASVVQELLDRLVNVRYDVRTTKECICLLSRMLSGQTSPYLDRLSANTNFVCEYPVINHMLQYGL